MKTMGVQAVFVVLLMLAATVKTEEITKGDATLSGKKVTLTCPFEGKWSDDPNSIGKGEKKQQHEFDFKDKGQYKCEYKIDDTDTSYLFYVKGKTCDNCFELDGLLFLSVVSADLIVSGLLILIIYRCNKKKSSDGPVHPTKAPVKSGGRHGPPVPSPDYESLNLATRTAETYSTVVNRMG